MSSLLAQLLSYLFARMLKGKPRAHLAVGIILILVGALLSSLPFANNHHGGPLGEVFLAIIGILIVIAGATTLVIGLKMLQRRRNAAAQPQQPSGQQPYAPRRDRYSQR